MQRAKAAQANTIAVVDDDRAVRNSLKFALEVEGYSVRAFAVGGDLLGSSIPHRYDCLVIDQDLPGMSGLELIARLRERRIDAPAILTTTNPTAAVIKGAKQAGIAVLEKPLLGNILIDKIHEICSHRGNGKEENQ
jgi:two-component system response regulator FixJ